MRGFALAGLFIASVIAVYIVASYKLLPENLAAGKLELRGVAGQICPQSAHLLSFDTEGRVLYDGEALVQDCRWIDLGTYESLSAADVYLKLPLAISTKQRLSMTGSGFVGLRFGDLNRDNVIDELDEAIMRRQLGQEGEGFDLDGDKILTVMDLGLIKLNKGTGVPRPDGRSWGDNFY